MLRKHLKKSTCDGLILPLTTITKTLHPGKDISKIYLILLLSREGD